MSELVSYEAADGVAVMTLNRPDRLNAVTRQMIDRLLDLFDITDADDNVRAVIVTGAGRAFCAGADLASGDGTFDYSDRPGAADAAAPRDGGGEFTLRVFRSLKPVIAAINGPAVGFGASMTLPMDFRIAARDAKVGFVFGSRGIVPDGAASWFLSRIVGIPTALDWCLTGRMFLAPEGLAHGLFNSLEDTAEVLPAAHRLARSIVEGAAPISATLTRQLIWTAAGSPHPMPTHRIESDGIFYTGRSPDASEGVRAFLEKRPPRWSMRVPRDLPPWFPWTEEPTYRE